MLTLDQTIQEALIFITERNAESAAIVDEDKTVGMITLEEIRVAIQNGHVLMTLRAFFQQPFLQEFLREQESDMFREMLASKMFSDMINSLYDGVYITDGYGFTVKVNTAYERITGISSEKIIGLHMNDLEKAGYISKSVSVQVIQEKKSLTRMQELANGRKVIVSASPVFNQEQTILYVVSSVRDITELIQLKAENNELKESKAGSETAANETEDFPFIAGDLETKRLMRKIAKTDVTVCLTGESGVGKTMSASYIHRHSLRKGHPFIEVNCGALPANLIEAELFGYVGGAFTGALSKGKKGLIEMANRGTLFLDEIGDMPLELQVKLLKVLDDFSFMPVGSTVPRKVDIRVIAATNQPLEELVEKGMFREDLYYRLTVVPMCILPLRERKKEIPGLLTYYLERFNAAHQEAVTLSAEAFDELCEYGWPGNIRELKNVIEYLIVTASSTQVNVEQLPAKIQREPLVEFSLDGSIIPLKKATDQVERHLIEKAMRIHKTTRKAAEALQVSQSTIVAKMKGWASSD
ncbi:sigma 54-interacting transcriptional regulator [Domibacillus mangrovi]|nr:sigma 54-interacting transcriptional regulator [Domibacillus mangrovi]